MTDAGLRWGRLPPGATVAMTAAMRPVARRARVDTVTAADLPPQRYLRRALRVGWVQEPDGAWVLPALRRSCFSSTPFVDVIDREGAANGRGINDVGLPAHGDKRLHGLVRRGFGVALAGLAALRRLDDPPVMNAAVGCSMSETDDPHWTGVFKFWADHGDLAPYWDVHSSGWAPGTMFLVIRTAVTPSR